MVGRHAMQVFAVLIFTVTAHSGIHGFLNARNYSNGDWQTNEPGYQLFLLDSRAVPWASHQPSGHFEQMCSITLTGVRSDAQNTVDRAVVCELSTVPIPDVSVPSRFKMNWPIVLDSNFMLGQLSFGCFQKFTLPSMMASAFK
ncbi:hypothetical protein PHET_02381 [Paragonimus heterotremus]|uniref:Secreted protein n=1 Tax=Paragonimus heterotremus TaxID=100268 RepID=A0A8J4X243_9TREM|nr:hypothetical protein PHET_02381 [Paragonimus heterotremus]